MMQVYSGMLLLNPTYYDSTLGASSPFSTQVWCLKFDEMSVCFLLAATNNSKRPPVDCGCE